MPKLKYTHIKKTKTLLLTCIITFVGINQANSQISAGPQLGYSISAVGFRNFTIGARGDYAMDDRYGIAASIGYHLPQTFESTSSLTSLNSNNRLDVAAKDRITAFKLIANGKYYFANTEYESDFGLYWILGASLSIYNYSRTITGDYDKTAYRPHESYEGDTQKESFGGFTINAGIGAEFMIGDNYLFTELKMLLPANEANGQSIDVDIPTFFHLTAGYRFYFD